MLTEQETLDLCNKVRKAAGGNILEALLPSDPGLSNSCLIARGLNFDCSIRPSLSGSGSEEGKGWLMYVAYTHTDKKYAIAEALGVSVGVYGGIPIPKELGQVAFQFDLDEEERKSEAKWLDKYDSRLI